MTKQTYTNEAGTITQYSLNGHTVNVYHTAPLYDGRELIGWNAASKGYTWIGDACESDEQAHELAILWLEFAADRLPLH